MSRKKRVLPLAWHEMTNTRTSYKTKRGVFSSVLVAVAALLLLVGAIALIGAYTFMPPILEASVARDVEAQYDLTQYPDVRLESDPQPAMLAGKFSGGRVSLRGAEFGGVRAESAVVDLEPFDVDVFRSLGRGRMVSEEPLSGDLRVGVSEAEISRLTGENATAPVSGVELERGRMVARSSTLMFGVEVPVSVAGNLTLRGGSLVFEPENLEAAGVPVPDDLADQLLAGAGFEYPLEDLPEGTTLTSVRVEGERLLLIGEMDRIRLGGSG